MIIPIKIQIKISSTFIREKGYVQIVEIIKILVYNSPINLKSDTLL